jgi:hypothetical protein
VESVSIPGASIGVLVGFIAAIITLVILKTLDSASISNLKSMLTLFGELTGLVVFVIAASFLTGSGLGNGDWIKEIRDSYVTFLTLTFLLIMIYPIFKWIIKLARDVGESRG